MPSTTLPAEVAAVGLLEALRETGALLDGHFVLSSGLHSAHYVQCARLLSWPRHAEFVGRALAGRVAAGAIDVVIGPALGGVVVAHEVARALGVRALFAERAAHQDSATLTLRRGFEIRPGERVLVCEDVVTTGGSARETAALVEAHGGTVVGFAAIVNRAAEGAAAEGTMPGTSLGLHALIRQPILAFDPADCPLCKAGTTAIKPGSRR